MNTNNLKKSTSVCLDKELYAYIEKLAEKENRNVNNFIETVLADATRFYEPNKETKNAIEEARTERSSLKRFDNTQNLLDDLVAD